MADLLHVVVEAVFSALNRDVLAVPLRVVFTISGYEGSAKSRCQYGEQGE